VPEVGEGEVGAIEKIGDRYYMMFGTGGLMVTLVADRPEGPFVPAKKNLRLLAGHTYFSRFFPIPGAVLVNHHSVARDGQVYFGLLKEARLDAEGTLRLGWWPGNEKLVERMIAVAVPPVPAGESPKVAMLQAEFEVSAGLVLKGTIRLPGSREAPRVGLFLPHASDAGTAILVDHAGITELGPMRVDGTGFTAEHRIDREWRYGATVGFRLLVRESLIEFYLDDLLIQCYSLPQRSTGKIGLIRGGRGDAIGDLTVMRP
jgi:hypothetical protein